MYRVAQRRLSMFTTLVLFAGSLVAPQPAQAEVTPGDRPPEVVSKERAVPGEPVTAKPRLPDPAGKATPAAAAEQPIVRADPGTKVRRLPGDGV